MLQANVRGERGGVMIVIIVILVVLVVGFACGNIVVVGRLQDLEAKRVALQEQIKEQEARNAALRLVITGAIVPIRKEYDKYFEEGTKDPARLPTDAEFEQKDELRNQYFYESLAASKEVKDGTKLLNTYQEIVPEAAARIHTARIHTIDAEHKSVLARDRSQSVKETEKKILEIQDKTIEELKSERAKIAQKVQEVDAAGNLVVEELKSKIVKVDEMTQKEKDEHQRKMADFEAEEKKLKEEIKKPKNPRHFSTTIEHPIFKVHGKVLEVDPRNKTGFIDIGSDQRVVKGMRFAAAKPGPRNGYVIKGAVEVKKLWENRCEVEIDAIDARNSPIIQGDLLINPLFDTRRPLVIAFLLDEDAAIIKMSEMNRSADEYKRRLMEIGSKPTTKIDVNTDFAVVIVGTSAEFRKDQLDMFVKKSPEFRKAEELNIATFTEMPDQPIKVTDLLWYLEFLYGR